MVQIAAAPGSVGPDSSPLDARLGPRVVAVLAGLVCAGVIWATLAFLDTAQAPVPGETPVAAASRSLGIAIDDVLAISGTATAAPDDETAAANLEDAWQGLANVHDHIHSQMEVGAGRRVPQMGAPPPGPGQMERDDALLRSALTYVRGALETRDLGPLHRAQELLEMGTSNTRR